MIDGNSSLLFADNNLNKFFYSSIVFTQAIEKMAGQ